MKAPLGAIPQDSPSDRILGVFLDNARDLIPIPLPTEETLLKRWGPVVKDAHAVGLTAVHDALLQPDTIDFFHKYDRSDSPHLASADSLVHKAGVEGKPRRERRP